MFEFSWGFAIIPTPYTYPNLLNKKASTPSERKYHIVSVTLLVFVDACENLVRADNVATPSNPLVSLVENEELEEAPLDVNVSKWSREEELSIRVVRTWVDRSTWDRRLSPNPHALTIYLEFVLACGAAPKRFEKCQTWVPGDGHYRWLWGPINHLSMEHQAEYLAHTIRRILEFLQLWSIPLKLFIKL